MFPYQLFHLLMSKTTKRKRKHIFSTAMRIPPKKPHFFKPILPGFKDGLKIPRGFLKYLKGHEHIEHAVLRRGSKQWQVKVNGRRLEDGWEKFAEEHDLQLGDLLVFRHEGNVEFEVFIFDSSHCDREYSEYLQEQEEEEEEEEANNVEDTSKNLEFEEIPSPSMELSDHAEAATHKPFGHSSFVCTIKPYCLTYGFLYVPKHFASANGFKTNKKCSLIIKDERQNSWTLRLSCCKTQVYIGDGCRKFIADNCLKEGDRIMFEVVTDGEIPIWKFHVVTDADTTRQKFQEKPELDIMSIHKVFPDAEASEDMPLGRPHLISAVKPHWISRSLMHVPKLFACENGLSNRKCTILIRDEQRSWEFSLFSCGRSTFIGGGWREFCTANFLKVGDRVMFEILAKAEKPIPKFYDLRANASLQPEEKKPNLDAKRVPTQGLGIDIPGMLATKARVSASTSANANPQFISTIRPYSISRTFLYLPLDFAKSNGLMNRRCEMILTDEKQRSWSVQLGPTGHHVAITRGWRKFVKANDVQVGDTFKFELINNGTIPTAHFHCKYSEKDGKNERST